MGLSIGVGGGNKINLAAEGDLAKHLKPGLDALLRLKDTVQGIRDIGSVKLADVPDGAFGAGFATDQEIKWDVGEGANIGVSFKPEARGGIRFTKSGSMLTFLEDGDHKKQFDIPVPEGSVAVSIEFLVNLEVTGQGGFSSGNLGVKANLGLGDRFRIANHRVFPASMKVLDALAQAFEQFQLPFRPDAVLNLGEHDLIDFEFTGRLRAGFGVTFAVSAPVLAGRAASEIAASVGHGLVKASLTADPTFRAGAEFGLKYTHEGAFRFVFGRDLARETKPVMLLVFRKDDKELETREAFGLKFDPGLKFDFASNADRVLSRAVDRLLARDHSAAAEELKTKVKTSGADAVQALCKKISGRVNELLEPVTEAKVVAQVEFLQNTSDVRMALFRMSFCSPEQATTRRAIDLALQGDLAGAIAAPGCELAPGSFVENQFIRRSGFGFQFFDLWKYTDVVEYVRQIDVEYAGEGMLRLIAKTGVSHSQGVFGRKSRCDAYFAAQLGESAADGAVSGLRVDFRFELSDRTKAQVGETQRLLAGLGSREAAAAAERASTFLPAGSAVKTTFLFEPAALTALRADAYSGSHPPPMPHPADAENYAAFARAADDVDTFRGFQRFEDWCAFNRVANDGQGSTMVPDRRNSGNLSQWPNELSGVRQSDRQLIAFHSESARQFMNLCESLHELQSEADLVKSDQAFGRFVDELNGIIENDVPASFLKATLLALARLCGGKPVALPLSVDADVLTIRFSLPGSAARALGTGGV